MYGVCYRCKNEECASQVDFVTSIDYLDKEGSVSALVEGEASNG